MEKGIALAGLLFAVATGFSAGKAEPKVTLTSKWLHELEATVLLSQYGTTGAPGIVWRGTVPVGGIAFSQRSGLAYGWNLTAGIMEVSGYGHGFIGGGFSGIATAKPVYAKLDVQALLLNSLDDYGHRKTQLQPALTGTIGVEFAPKYGIGLSATYLPESTNDLVRRRPIFVYGMSLISSF